MGAIYNEIEPYAVRWLHNLIDAEHVAKGPVDGRDIRQLQPADVAGAVQFHAFAGIGVWSHALRLAGWPDDVPVWTGSCPCQPFSDAGARRGVEDPRHLWPEWLRLIRQCRPAVIFGEQVASKAGRGWLAVVRADLEALGYAVGAADLCAAGTGAPHIRQRLYWVAHAAGRRCGPGGGHGPEGYGEPQFASDNGSRPSRLGNAVRTRAGGHTGATSGTQTPIEGKREFDRVLGHGLISTSADGGLGDAVRERRQESPQRHGETGRGQDGERGPDADRSSFWAATDWLPCYDKKARPVEPGTFPLAHGATARVGRLRAYGNAIVAPLATHFIKAFTETLGEQT